MTVSQRARAYLWGAGLACVAALHAVFAWSIHELKAEMTVLDRPPTADGVEVAAFGDHQFVYRVWTFNLQNAGDTGGRATRMVDYDYDRVLGWLTTLQGLDPRAHHHTFLAAKYFSQTSNTQHVRRIIDFVAADVAKAPDIKWWWLTQIMAAAEHGLKDSDLALRLSLQLASYDFPDSPSWTWLFPAVLMEKQGKIEEARAFIHRVRAEKAGRFEDGMVWWMGDFERRWLNP